MSSRVTTFSRQGFTLVEVLVALACMAIGFVALWSVHYSSLKADIRSDLETGAMAAAHSQLDFLRTLTFTNARLTDGNHTANDGDPPLTGTFSRSHTVVTDPNLAWKKTVTVTVTWSEKVGGFGGNSTVVQRNVRMSTFIVDLG
jgi:prepilin-type N-terminal cleavage/methylation domain-containing protein